MNNPAPELEEITGILTGLFSSRDVRGFADDALLQTTGALERLSRRLGALQVTVAAEVDHRSRPELGTDGLAATKGCRNSTELLERITLAASETIAKRLKVGRNTRTRFSLVGEQLPAPFEHVAEALTAGTLGLDSAHTIIRGLTSVAPVVDALSIHTAEYELVAAATGVAPESPYPCTADETRIQTDVWKVRLDQDGRMPIEERALRMRSLTLGRDRDGLVWVRGALIPDVDAKFTALLNAYLSPRTAPAFLNAEELAAHNLEHDPRTRDQKRHDIFAGIVDIAARSAETPTMGGAAPVVMVSVRQSDLDNDRGVGHIDGLETPVSIRVVKQYTCNGGTQRVVFDDTGRIIELGSPERCFTQQQRRAITLRDGECSIPACHIPAAWCEIHHVDPAENGGPTHTDNGLMLCWFHHRTLDKSGWQFQMLGGAPHVKAPRWYDPTQQWRPTTGSRIRRMDAVDKIPITQQKVRHPAMMKT
jgi:5-methylcytosine-specific restriction protein A